MLASSTQAWDLMSVVDNCSSATASTSSGYASSTSSGNAAVLQHNSDTISHCLPNVADATCYCSTVVSMLHLRYDKVFKHILQSVSVYHLAHLHRSIALLPRVTSVIHQLSC